MAKLRRPFPRGDHTGPGGLGEGHPLRQDEGMRRGPAVGTGNAAETTQAVWTGALTRTYARSTGKARRPRSRPQVWASVGGFAGTEAALTPTVLTHWQSDRSQIIASAPRRRSVSVVPPQIPSVCPVRTAQSRHCRTTGHPPHTALASSIWWSVSPPFPMGKKRSGSSRRQAARSCQGAAESSRAVVMATETSGARRSVRRRAPASVHKRQSSRHICDMGPRSAVRPVAAADPAGLAHVDNGV